MLAFFNFIHSKLPASLDPDCMCWKLRQHGEFDVKSFYHALDVKLDIKFLGKLFGGSKLRDKSRFSCGLRLGGGF